VSVFSGDIRTVVKPLRFIFFGGLLCVFDLSVSQTVNGEGWTFDILNDLVGMLMITWAVFQLAKIRLHDRYGTAMAFVKVMAVLSCLTAFHAHFIYAVPSLISFLLCLVSIAAMIAIIVFCVAMRWLSVEAGLQRSARSWKTTALLFVFIYLVPIGLFYFAAAIAIVTGTSFNINLGPAGLLLMPLFALPLIHLFMSTSRMQSEARNQPQGSLFDASLEAKSNEPLVSPDQP
jgi:hypothetical protein